MRDLGLLRGIRDHFVKHYEHAEDWADHMFAHGGCIAVHGQALASGGLCAVDSSNACQEFMNLLSGVAGNQCWLRLRGDKAGVLRDIERAIARLEEKEILCEPVIPTSPESSPASVPSVSDPQLCSASSWLW